MPKLDGTEKLAPTPFDAHEQATRTVKHEHREYPKVIGQDADGNDIVAKDADHETKLKGNKARIVKGA
jgi:hypothetical protein